MDEARKGALLEEAELIARARDGDRRAMQRLYEEHAPHVYGVVRRLAGDDHLAEDVSQDVWIRAFKKLDTFRGESGFGTWIHRVARNVALTRLRRKKDRGEVDLDRSASPTERGPEEVVLSREMLEKALDRLPDGYREVLILHDVEGLTHREIAESLGVAVGTSKSQLHKARARMRELLGSGRDTEDRVTEREAKSDG
jgi:RNA polymerase sigma-70 factor (ECF subfamily)